MTRTTVPPDCIWFRLDRHDGDDPPADPPTNPPADPPTDPPADPPKDEPLGDAGKKALAEERKARKTAEAELARYRKAEQDRLDADRTELERAQARQAEAEQKAAAATQRAVQAEVRALADGFADREDAILNLGDLSQYVADGEVDTEAIAAALKDVLERKPHLAKNRTPAPDPSQGRGGDSNPTDYRKAAHDEFAAELAKYGLRPRSR